MFNYPVEKNTLRFYKFKFWGIEKQVTIEAFNGREARILLRDFILMNQVYQNVPIINLSIAIPIVGETTKMVDNIEMVYVPNGWMPLWEFEKQYGKNL